VYVLVRQPFTLGKKVHHRGDVVLVMAELETELPDLLRAGVVVVVKSPDDPVQLQTPEDGQSLTLR
jgi:hypothetical protein